MRRAILAISFGFVVAAQPAFAGEAGSEAKAESWADKVTLKGDIRFRLERIEEDGKDDRDRARIRARAGAIATPSGELEAGFQLTTSQDNDPVSANQTLTDGFSRKDVFIDLAYIDYHPDALPGAGLVAGKMNNPFWRVSDLHFDNDLTPEGVALRYESGKPDDALTFFLNGAGFWAQERSSDDETVLYGAQAGARAKLSDNTYVKAGLAQYIWDNLKGFRTLVDEADGFGNTVDEELDPATGDLVATSYVNDYEITELTAEVGCNAVVPVSLYGNYLVNGEADGEDTGYLVGLRIGKSRAPGSFDFDYSYRDLERDAVVGAFTDSDSFGGGTDGEGHRFTLGYQVAKNLKGNVTYSFSDADVSSEGRDYSRVQVDLTARF